MSKIPKVIHYCWFGGNKKPESVNKYIKSWKKYCPDYKIIEWNEKNFDVNSNLYAKQAYELKKYSFVTDYVRLYVLYHYGGVYMDSDVEVLKPLDRFLNDRAFSSFETETKIPTGIMASEKHNKWIGDLLSEYDDLPFIKENGEPDLVTNVDRITNMSVAKYGLVEKNSYQVLKGGVATIYPKDYFCPKSWETSLIELTENSYTIHHFSGSWLPKEQRERRDYMWKSITKYTESGLSLPEAKKKAASRYKVRYATRHPLKTAAKITKKAIKK